MALPASLTVFDTKRGDINLNSAQAGAIGASFGNGAAQFGQNPSNPLQMGDDGNLVCQIASAGVSPAVAGSDYVVALASIPVGAFDIAMRGIAILAAGSNTTTAITVKIVVGATAPAVGSVVSGGATIATLTATATGGWQIQANLFKYGAPGSNTQMAIHEAGQVGATLSALTAPSLLTQNEAAPLTVAITINATTTNTNAVFNFLQIFCMN